MALDLWSYLLIGVAAFAAGLVNALAGGGTLITFPMLTAVGIPAVAANVTNTVALCPGYLGATLAQLKDLKGQKTRLLWLVPASVIGGVIGGVLLLASGERLFRELTPFLVLLASGLLAVSDPLRAWVTRRMSQQSVKTSTAAIWVAGPMLLAAIYGGYFGAGLSIIILAVLGLVLNDSLTVLNGLKQILAFSVNIAAAIFFLFSGQVVWPAAAVMAVFALLGGAAGGRLAGRVKPATLRWMVVGIGLIVSFIYFLK